MNGLDSPATGFLWGQVVDQMFVKAELTAVRLQKTTQDLDSAARALARPVVADQSNDLSRMEVHRHASQRADAAKEFCIRRTVRRRHSPNSSAHACRLRSCVEGKVSPPSFRTADKKR